MGCASSAEALAQSTRSKRIDSILRKEKESEESERPIKILLLGGRETGKSTILKQMKLIYNVQFTPAELIEFKNAIRSNIVDCMRIMVVAMDTLKIPLGFDPNDAAISTISEMDLMKLLALTSKTEDAIALLWNDTGIQHCFTRSSEYQLMDNCKYVMDNRERICALAFTPTETDILYTRQRTQAITEIRFNHDDRAFRVFDFGGQRKERNKWAAYFQDVSAVIYIAALSSFDQKLMEDESVNRMAEAIALFSAICNHPLFKSIGMIVFLNKIDLFQQKIKTVQISEYFPDYAG
ncbi:guanine nucleotide binding protein, alpha subunit, partial [Chytriomyces sp. MP71]